MKNILITLVLTLCFSLNATASKRGRSGNEVYEDMFAQKASSQKKEKYTEQQKEHALTLMDLLKATTHPGYVSDPDRVFHASISTMLSLPLEVEALKDRLQCSPEDLLVVIDLDKVTYVESRVKFLEDITFDSINSLIKEGYKVIFQTAKGQGKKLTEEVEPGIFRPKKWVKAVYTHLQSNFPNIKKAIRKECLEFCFEKPRSKLKHFTYFFQGVYFSGHFKGITLWNLLQTEDMQSMFGGGLPEAAIIVDDTQDVHERHMRHPALSKLTHRIMFEQVI